jgi:hypothetical protein
MAEATQISSLVPYHRHPLEELVFFVSCSRPASPYATKKEVVLLLLRLRIVSIIRQAGVSNNILLCSLV